MQNLIQFNHERQRFIMIDPRPPANAFEWKRYVVEESIRRGDQDTLNANETSRKRSLASSRAVERQLAATQSDAKFSVFEQFTNKTKRVRT